MQKKPPTMNDAVESDLSRMARVEGGAVREKKPMRGAFSLGRSTMLTTLWQHRTRGHRAAILIEGDEVIVRIASPSRVQSYRLPIAEAGSLLAVGKPTPPKDEATK